MTERYTNTTNKVIVNCEWTCKRNGWFEDNCLVIFVDSHEHEFFVVFFKNLKSKIEEKPNNDYNVYKDKKKKFHNVGRKTIILTNHSRKELWQVCQHKSTSEWHIWWHENKCWNCNILLPQDTYTCNVF